MNAEDALLMFRQIYQSRSLIGPFGKESVPENLQEQICKQRFSRTSSISQGW